MLEGFIIGWIASASWVILIVPFYLLKMSFRMID